MKAARLALHSKLGLYPVSSLAMSWRSASYSSSTKSKPGTTKRSKNLRDILKKAKELEKEKAELTPEPHDVDRNLRWLTLVEQ
jgi:hypothetical protein